MFTGKCYQSNKKSYHKIRYQSDKLCKENNLSVIDEHYESYKKKYRTNGKSWYENALSELKKSYSKLPNSKDILYRLDKLQEKKNTLMQEYSLNKEQFSDLGQFRKNYENYYGIEVER